MLTRQGWEISGRASPTPMLLAGRVSSLLPAGGRVDAKAQQLSCGESKPCWVKCIRLVCALASSSRQLRAFG